jgi:hypothetical protein
MTPIRLPEGGRAALAFPFDGDWARTQRSAMFGATRRCILDHWSDFPDWLRKDQGFQCLMDCYYPVDDATFAGQVRRRQEVVREHLKSLLGAAVAEMYDRACRDPGQPITDDEVVSAIRAVPGHNACLDYGVPFGNIGAALSTNSTTRTVVGVKCPAQQATRFWGIDIGFDGTTSTNGPAICELSTTTWATNPPGTNSTSVTPNALDSGRPETIQGTTAKAWTVEPTVLSLVETFFIPSYMGSGIVFTPLTKPFVGKGGNGASMRVQQQPGVTANSTGCLKAEEG